MNFFICILIADFISGIGHWLEDTYGNPNIKYGASIVHANIEHHSTPRSFLGRTYWYRNNSLIIFFTLIPVIAFLIGWGSWELTFTCLLLSQTNEIHAFAHRKKSETPKLILCLQEMGFLQSSRHHAVHHQRPYQYRMCIITNFLNPILDGLKFWHFMELVILKIFNLKPYRGTEVRGFH